MTRPAPILLVEDDQDIRETLADLLDALGYPVVTAEHGRDALDQLAAGLRPSIVLLDLMMPVMNGWELRAAMVADEALRDIPVVLVCGVHDIETQAEELDCRDYVPKPIDVARLRNVLAKVA